MEQQPAGCDELIPQVRTSSHFGDCERSINECYLFHGTCWQNAVQILQSGFRNKNVPGDRTDRKPMFQGGIYFAECASKADEYSEPSEALMRAIGTAKPLLTLLLCRVLLGKLWRTTRPHRDVSIQKLLDANSANSVVCDLEATCDTYREFILPESDSDLILPEFLLIYERSYASSKSRRWLRP
eukprot:symbB.v1.2.026994.t1/scaffold2736.1/size71972/3